jgi:hypothetical protein
MIKAAATWRGPVCRFGAWLTAVVLTVATVAVGTSVAGAGEAGADSFAQCSTTVGEIVVVDFVHWDGQIIRGCDATLTTGYNALYQAGFITEGTQEDGPGFICRIGLANQGASSYKPTPSQDSCVNTPPASDYWSYWHADAGQHTWSYSQQGPISYQPPPGSVDAWVYGPTNISGTTGQPPFAPSEVRATNTSPAASATTSTSTAATSPSPTAPTPVPTASPTTSASLSATVSSTTNPASAGAGTGKGSTKSPSSSKDSTTTTLAGTAGRHAQTGGPPATGPVTTTTPQGKVSQTRPKIVTLGPLAAGRPPSSAGSPLPFAIGATVVLVLVAGGGLVARRRHRSSGP